LIYGVSPTKNKVLSSSLGSGVTSAKFLPSHSKNLSSYTSSSNLQNSSIQVKKA